MVKWYVMIWAPRRNWVPPLKLLVPLLKGSMQNSRFCSLFLFSTEITFLGKFGLKNQNCQFKGCVCYIFASFFKALKRALMKLGKMFFIWLEKLFSFFRKSNFRILDIQVLWRHEMSKHKTNTFYWITWEVNKFC